MAAPKSGKDPNEKKQDPSDKKQDPRVEQLRPDPSQSAPRSRTLSGLWGDSDRQGHRRLYLTRDLTTYAEFAIEDVVVVTDIPPEQSPFLGEQSTRVELRHDAEVTLTNTRRVGDVDEFDLDVRFGSFAARPFGSVFASSDLNQCVKRADPITKPCDYTCEWICKTYQGPRGRGCDGGGTGRVVPSAECGTFTCNTCEGATRCGTCHTDYGVTACGTCFTDVGHTQCGTCYTELGQTQCGGCDRLVPR